ncbi:MAG: RelA/SpoT family protein [Coriobacteriales bacterium]|jgi:guanosine-3',5'-bis(diphosphate) 3'-pyrophosphohydrolase
MYDDPIKQFDDRIKQPEDSYAKLMKQAATYLDEDDLALVSRAYEFAKKAHAGQKRKSGEPFINHPTEVAYILSEIRMDAPSLAAALLHDTVEDTDVTREQVAEGFSEEIATLVDGVTKISNLQIESLTEAQSKNFRKMMVAMSKDVRVTVIKLADRLHNMRTLMALPEDRRIFKAKETMEVYAPLANRLGISSIKWELEDLSFYYLEPAKYKQIARMVAESREAREEYLAQAIDILQAELDKVGIDGKISGRPKHLYSIYQKMTQRGKDFSEIYDLIALRIIVDDVKDCYSSLGVVHTLWYPMPGRFKDYIAMPKFNMYQSLHTTVIGPAGRPLEVQIRTKEMHRISEYGVAAHWRYKAKNAGHKVDDDTFDAQLTWLRQMLDWQDDTEDPKEFMNSLKVDLFENEVFVFTPKGEVISLRAGATPLDFAYAIHTQVGHHCVGAKVNGSIVPLSYELQSGDRVEILTQQNSNPSRDWLNIVKTPSARSKIRSYLSKASKGDDLLHGRDVLAREMRKSGLGISSSRSVAALKKIADELNYNDPDDVFAAIGSGKLSGKQVANMLLKELQKSAEEREARSQAKLNEVAGMELNTSHIAKQNQQALRKRRNDSGVIVKGVDDALVHLSRCCNPVPGDEIVGFVTRGRGVTVHRVGCPNIKDLKDHPERFIEVEWDSDKNVAFSVELYVAAVDRTRLLQDVAIKLSDLGTNILQAYTNSNKDGLVEMRFVVQTSSAEHIDNILRSIKSIEGAFEARRMLPGEFSMKKKG